MTGKEEFAERLARIQSGRAANQLGAVHVGPSEASFAPAARAQAEPETTPAWSLPLALLLGGLAVVGGKAAAFHLLRNSPSVDATTATVIAAGDALIIAYVLGQTLGFSRLAHRLATGLGLAAVVALFHNFAHWAPVPMAQIFSEDWVSAAQAAAPANTVWLGKDYVALAPEPEADPAPCPPPQKEVTILQTDHAKKTKPGHKQVAAPQAEEPCAP